MEDEPVTTAPASPPPALVNPAPPTDAPVEELLLPPLDESDSLVRARVGALTSHPAFAAWLIPDDLLRTFVSWSRTLLKGTIRPSG